MFSHQPQPRLLRSSAAGLDSGDEVRGRRASALCSSVAFSPDRREIYILDIRILLEHEREIELGRERGIALLDAGADTPVRADGRGAVAVEALCHKVERVVHVLAICAHGTEIVGLCFKKCVRIDYSPPVIRGHVELAPDYPRAVFFGRAVVVFLVR